jgi:hypothetical protein
MDISVIFWIGLALFVCYAIARGISNGAKTIKDNETASKLTKKAAESLFSRLFK